MFRDVCGFAAGLYMDKKNAGPLRSAGIFLGLPDFLVIRQPYL